MNKIIEAIEARHWQWKSKNDEVICTPNVVGFSIACLYKGFNYANLRVRECSTDLITHEPAMGDVDYEYNSYWAIERRIKTLKDYYEQTI